MIAKWKEEETKGGEEEETYSRVSTCLHRLITRHDVYLQN